MKSLKYNGPKNPSDWAAALGQLALDVVSTENGKVGVAEMKGADGDHPGQSDGGVRRFRRGPTDRRR